MMNTNKTQILDTFTFQMTRDEFIAAWARGEIRITTTDGRMITPETKGWGYHVDARYESLVKGKK